MSQFNRTGILLNRAQEGRMWLSWLHDEPEKSYDWLNYVLSNLGDNYITAN